MRAVAFFDSHGSQATNMGRISGTVEFQQMSPGSETTVTFHLRGFSAGTRNGVHIHTYGDATEGCTSSCDHFNPAGTGQLHGSQYLYGKSRHVGDLCNNITADWNGCVDYQYSDDLVSLWGSNTVIGRMVVIHGSMDDLGAYRDEPSKRGEGSRTTGNAGERIACAVIGLAKPPSSALRTLRQRPFFSQ